jgi:hypothetical protein
VRLVGFFLIAGSFIFLLLRRVRAFFAVQYWKARALSAERWPHELLEEKTAELERVRKEVEALRLSCMVLDEADAIETGDQS